MDLETTVLNALAQYGAVAVFAITVVAAIGLPLPASFMLVVAGAFIGQGDLDRWPVVLAAATGAILGDHVGYGVGRLGGRKLALRLSARLRAEHLLDRADRFAHRYGGLSIFFSRWLVGALGPYVNLTTGITHYALPRFSAWDVLGEIVWVLAYVQLGILFYDQLSLVTDVLGDFTWLGLGLLAVFLIGYRLIKEMRRDK